MAGVRSERGHRDAGRWDKAVEIQTSVCEAPGCRHRDAAADPEVRSCAERPAWTQAGPPPRCGRAGSGVHGLAWVCERMVGGERARGEHVCLRGGRLSSGLWGCSPQNSESCWLLPPHPHRTRSAPKPFSWKPNCPLSAPGVLTLKGFGLFGQVPFARYRCHPVPRGFLSHPSCSE